MQAAEHDDNAAQARLWSGDGLTIQLSIQRRAGNWMSKLVINNSKNPREWRELRVGGWAAIPALVEETKGRVLVEYTLAHRLRTDVRRWPHRCKHDGRLGCINPQSRANLMVKIEGKCGGCNGEWGDCVTADVSFLIIEHSPANEGQNVPE